MDFGPRRGLERLLFLFKERRGPLGLKNGELLLIAKHDRAHVVCVLLDGILAPFALLVAVDGVQNAAPRFESVGELFDGALQRVLDGSRCTLLTRLAEALQRPLLVWHHVCTRSPLTLI